MQVFRLANKTTIPVVESYLTGLNEFNYDAIALPAEPIKSAGLGGESALIQYILTWARSNPGSPIVTPMKLGDAAEEGHMLKHLANRAYSFVGLLAAHDVLAADESTSVRTKTNLACSRCVDKMQRDVSAAKFGHRTFLACVDHSTKSHIPHFYHLDGTLRSRSEFVRLAQELLDSRTSLQAHQRTLGITSNSLGKVLYEVVKNTHDWGRRSIDNVPLRPSLRGILFTRFNLPLAGVVASTGGNPSLRSYAEKLAEYSRDGYVRFLEVSVFDSGPGLALRWLGCRSAENLELRDEHRACLDCLAKHKSTSRESMRGLGLYDIMATLSQLQGYIRVRTGRLALCRNFISSPLESHEQIHGPQLFDWTTSQVNPTAMARAEGTLVTFVIPLFEKES